MKPHTIIMLSLLFIGSAAAGSLPAEKQFEQAVAALQQNRKKLFTQYKRARAAQKATIRQQARELVVSTLMEKIFPAWLKKPWTMAVIQDGLKPDAAHPFETGKGISCSWFIVSTLRNAGLRFVNPRRFAGTISIHLQYALTPKKSAVRRYFNISPSALKQKLIKRGNGLYLMGLNCHVGFVYVHQDTVLFIHSSYVSPAEVVMEPIEKSAAVALSVDAGYVVSPLFQDRRLIDHWLASTKVPFQKFPKSQKAKTQ